MKKKTVFFNQCDKKWILIDARDKVLGRLATRIARILQGKHKSTYSPNAVCGDKVVVINARYARLTGDKAQAKVYNRYSGYHSGRKEVSFRDLQERRPTFIVYHAVKGMLPKNKLSKVMLRSLKIYADDKYRQQAQQPQLTEV